jgi:Mg2+ and Co2+ transporter CorA
MSHTPELYIKEKEFLKILSINTDTEIYGNHEEIYLLYCLLDEFAQQELQAMRTELEELKSVLKLWEITHDSQVNQMEQLRTDKARLVEALQNARDLLAKYTHKSSSIMAAEIQELLTEMEGGK